MSRRGSVSRNRRVRELRKERYNKGCCVYCNKKRSIMSYQDVKEYLALIFKRNQSCISCGIKQIKYTREKKKRDEILWKSK